MIDLHRKPYQCACAVLLCIAVATAWLLLSTSKSVAQQATTRWEQPVVLFDAGQAAKVFNPLIVEDTQGRIRILWETTTVGSADPGDLTNGIYCSDGDGEIWSAAIDVITAPDGGRAFWPQHAMDAYGQLHLIWVGPNARLYHSRTPSAEACDARNWETVVLPISDQVLHGDIFIDSQDILHIAYAARARDVYYMRSLDDGLSWSDPVAVSAVQPSVATSFPSLAIDTEGRIHVAWEQNQLPDGVPSLGLFYASSQDGGITWSSPVPFSQTEGEYTQPVVVTLPDGTVHLLWNGRISTRGRYHQWSTDGGASWSGINEFVPKSMGGGQTGPPGIALDSAGTLHVVTGTDDTTYTAWRKQRWLPAYDIASYQTLGNMEDQNIGVVRGRELYVVANAGLRKIILIRGLADAPEVTPQFKVLPTQPQETAPAIATPRTTSSATPSPTVVALAPELASPPSQANSLTPILLSSGLAFLVVAAVVAMALGRRRS